MHDTSEGARTRYSCHRELTESSLEPFIKPLLGEVPKVHEAHKRVQYYVSYNVLSLRRLGRMQSIFDELQFCSVIAMQGTRERQVNKLSVHLQRVGKFIVLHSGYGVGGNSHAGVALAFNTRFVHQKHIHSYAYPSDARIVGRCLAVRVRSSAADLLHISIYFPPSTTRRAAAVSKLIVAWVSDVLRKAAVRVFPVLYMDCNSQFGLNMDGESISSSATGVYGVGKENEVGTIIREFMEKWNLVLTHTHR